MPCERGKCWRIATGLLIVPPGLRRSQCRIASRHLPCVGAALRSRGRAVADAAVFSGIREGSAALASR
jgi:hypothetical protein